MYRNPPNTSQSTDGYEKGLTWDFDLEAAAVYCAQRGAATAFVAGFYNYHCYQLWADHKLHQRPRKVWSMCIYWPSSARRNMRCYAIITLDMLSSMQHFQFRSTPMKICYGPHRRPAQDTSNKVREIEAVWGVRLRWQAARTLEDS